MRTTETTRNAADIAAEQIPRRAGQWRQPWDITSIPTRKHTQDGRQEIKAETLAGPKGSAVSARNSRLALTMAGQQTESEMIRKRTAPDTQTRQYIRRKVEP